MPIRKINPKYRKQKPEDIFSQLPTETIVEAINLYLHVLAERGVKIYDWDHKKKHLIDIKNYGKIFFRSVYDEGDI